MNTKTILLLSLLALPAFVQAEPEELSRTEAFLAASLAAWSTPKMKDAPIKVHASISKASGVQEDYGATAIVAIPDEAASKLDLVHLGSTAVPLCRLWVKGHTLTHKGKVVGTGTAERLEVSAQGEKHHVTLWLLGMRKSAAGTPEMIICANQREPVLVLPAEALARPLADHAVPVKVGVTKAGKTDELRLTLLGTHQVKLGLAK